MRHFVGNDRIKSRFCLQLVWITAVLWLLPSLAMAQPTDSVVVVHHFSFSADWAVADHLGQVYAVTALKTLEKYTPDGRKLASYSQNRYGKITGIDVSNPLKLLVWFGDFRRVVFLDRSLTQLGELDLIRTPYPEVRVTASAQDGNLWIYDEVEFKLRKLTPQGEQLFESPALNLLLSDVPTVTGIQETDQTVYVSAGRKGVLIFDAFAKFLRPVSLPDTVHAACVWYNRLYYLSGNPTALNLYTFGPIPKSHSFPLPYSDQSKWVLSRGFLLNVKKDELVIYRY